MRMAQTWWVAGLMLALGGTPSAATAQSYRCTVDGKVVYQQAPCPGGREIKGQAAPTPEDSARAKIELAITRRQVLIGMTAREVTRAWGEPDKINRSVSASVVREQWVYRRDRRIGNEQYLYFDDGVLTSAQGPG